MTKHIESLRDKVVGAVAPLRRAAGAGALASAALLYGGCTDSSPVGPVEDCKDCPVFEEPKEVDTSALYELEVVTLYQPCLPPNRGDVVQLVSKDERIGIDYQVNIEDFCYYLAAPHSDKVDDAGVVTLGPNDVIGGKQIGMERRIQITDIYANNPSDADAVARAQELRQAYGGDQATVLIYWMHDGQPIGDLEIGSVTELDGFRVILDDTQAPNLGLSYALRNGIFDLGYSLLNSQTVWGSQSMEHTIPKAGLDIPTIETVRLTPTDITCYEPPTQIGFELDQYKSQFASAQPSMLEAYARAGNGRS